MSGPTYRVLCADDECRHEASFATAKAAANWLENSHVKSCGGLQYHQVEVTDVNGVTWPAVDARALPFQIKADQLASAS
jgi:hypothetical protein